MAGASAQDRESDFPFPGGDVVFTPGKGTPPGAIVFRLASGEEFMRIESEGSVTVQGQLVDHNLLVYAAFRQWLHQAIVHRDKPEKPALAQAEALELPAAG